MTDPESNTVSPVAAETAVNSRAHQIHEKASRYAASHPVLAICLISFLSVVINCYPVVFGGKSFVSPVCTGLLVHTWWPSVPAASPHGSDTSATTAWGVPAGFIESRSLLQYHELPLWDRYGHAGSTFLGQAVTMLGDPLQFIVIFGHGAAGAWDLKFLTAKFLFCVGLGLLVFRLMGNHRVALISAALAAYCGAFFYIYNHPVFFPFCYSPWILLAALGLLDRHSRQHLRWGMVWLLANFACFNGGHVEVGVLLIGGFNLAALAYALACCRHLADVTVTVARMAVATVLLIGLTAPVWLTFLVSLPGAYSMHGGTKVFQLEPRCLAGVFDDRFYHFLLPPNTLQDLAPGSSLLVFVGCLLSFIRWRRLGTDRFFWVNSAAIFFWGACIFGGIPAWILEHVPMINRVHHNFTDFSYPLIFHLTIQCAYGFKAFAEETQFKHAARDLLWALLGLILLVVWYQMANHPPFVPWSYFLCVGVGALGAPLLYAWLKQRGPRISAIGWAGIFVMGFLAQFRFGIYDFGDENLLTVPGPRLVLNAPSPAVERIQKDSTDPFRVVGFDEGLLGEYAPVYGLETIMSLDPLTSGAYMDLVVNYPGINLRYGSVITVADPGAAQPLLDFLNVKYILTPPAVRVDPGLDYRVIDRSDFGVLENPDAWPRAFFTDHIVSLASTGEFANWLWANARKPFVALTPEEIARRPELSALLGKTNATVSAATHYRLRPNSTAFDIHAPDAGVVCLMES